MRTEIGESDYRQASFQRLDESFILFQREKFAGSVYLGGRAVESMLRAVIWKHDHEIKSGRQSLETGHDLRELLARVNALGVVQHEELRAALAANVQRVARVWFNNMRFYPTIRMERAWWMLGEIRKRHTLKQAVRDFHVACATIVKRCEALCE